MTLKQILAMNVKYYRYKMGFSQEKFCNTFNYSRTYINEVENAKRNPSLEWLEQIAKNFKISINELLTYNENHLIKNKRIDQKNI